MSETTATGPATRPKPSPALSERGTRPTRTGTSDATAATVKGMAATARTTNRASWVMRTWAAASAAPTTHAATAKVRGRARPLTHRPGGIISTDPRTMTTDALAWWFP